MNILIRAFVLATIGLTFRHTEGFLLTKKNPKIGPLIREKKYDTFYKFLQHTNAYVDKTLFVESILNTFDAHHQIIITAPPRWSKSLNLKLLWFFLETELEDDGTTVPQDHTKAFKFFRRGEIKNVFGWPEHFNEMPSLSHHPKLIKNYLGKFPVITLDFGSFSGLTNFTQYMRLFKSSLKRTFSRHANIVENLCVNRLDIYGHYMPEGNCTEKELLRFYEVLGKEPMDQTNLRRSVALLSKLLNTSYDRQVILLIDNFDSFLHNLYTKQYGYLSFNETMDLEKFYLKFLRSVLTSDHIYKVIMTGVLPILFDYGLDFEGIKYLRHTQPEIHRFYGFSENETNALTKYANIHESSTRKACTLYNGYHIENHPKTKLFNPWEMVKFVNNGDPKSYAIDNYSQTFIYEVLRNGKITNLLKRLRSYQCLRYKTLQPYSYMNLRRLEGIRYNYNNDTESHHLLLWYLNAVGVLTVVHNATESYCCKLPNLELHNELNSILFGNQITFMYEPDAANALMELMEEKTDKVTVLLRYFKKMLIFDSQVDNWEINESELQLRFFDILYTASKTYDYEVTTELPLKITKTEIFTPSMVIRKKYTVANPEAGHQITEKSTAIIIEIKYQQTNNNLKRILQQDLWPYSRAYFNANPQTKCLKLMMLNVRDTLIIQYINSTFANVSDIPSYKNAVAKLEIYWM